MSPLGCNLLHDEKILYIFVLGSYHFVIFMDKYGIHGNMAIKIDIRKAFDFLDWNFLLDVLEAFGFCLQFRDWILTLFSSTRFSILLNGKVHGYFSCSRGVR